MKQVRVALVGVGNVGKAFLELMVEKAGLLAEKYSLELVLTAAVDSSGGVANAGGIAPQALLAHKQGGKGVSSFAGGSAAASALDVVAQADADLLLDASPVNLKTGEPGLSCVRTAINRGIGVVLANKAPLVLAFSELTGAAKAAGLGFAYSATVCGALPVVNIGQRDLVGMRDPGPARHLQFHEQLDP